MIDHTKKLVQEKFNTGNGYSYDAEVCTHGSLQLCMNKRNMNDA